MENDWKYISIRQLPVSWLLIWVGAFLFTVFAVLQAYTTALQSGTTFPSTQVFIFWPLNYSIWACMVPFIFHTFFLPVGKRAMKVLVHIGIGLFWAIIHYIIVSFLTGWILNIFSLSQPPINLFNYILFYFPTSILSHCFDYLLITAILLILDFYQKNYQNQLAIVQLEKQLKSTQLDALKMQLNPHFFFNTLNTIASFMGNNEKGQEVIGTLGRLLRAMLKEEKHQMTSLRAEVEYIQDYLRIEELRFEDRLQVGYEIAPDTLQASVPVLILQPLVENAIKHGLVDQQERGELLISSQRSADQLILKVRDNGIGSPLTIAEMLSKPGLGLNNVKQRLDYLYGDNYDIRIHTAEKRGFEVILNIPFQLQTQESKPFIK